MDDLISKKLVFDYFSGNVTPLEKKHIESWLGNPANRDTYYLWLHEWETAHLQWAADWQAAFADTQRRVGEDGGHSTPGLQEKRSVWKRFPAWAAACLLVILGIGGWLAFDILRYQSVETGYGQTRRYILPDGSVVALNANSGIWFPRFGFGKKRVVTLRGEADFSVTHLPGHRRFTVLTDKGLTVNVIGTQFTVFSRLRKTSVVLRSGKVELTIPKKHNRSRLTMKPGDLVTLDEKGRLAVTRTARPEELSAWKEHRFFFEQTSLYEISEMLEENYGLTVKISDRDLGHRTISGSFPAGNANEIIRMVAELLQINYFRENDMVIFTN